MNRENAFFNEGLPPDQIQEFTLGHQPSCTPQERNQHIVSLWLQGNRLAALRKPPFKDVQREVFELVLLVAGHES